MNSEKDARVPLVICILVQAPSSIEKKWYEAYYAIQITSISIE